MFPDQNDLPRHAILRSILNEGNRILSFMPRSSRVLLLLLCGVCALAPVGRAADGPNANVGSTSNYAQRLASARSAYFRDVEGEHDADALARQQFDALHHEHPNDPVVTAYSGSLELLEAARTWAVWKKHTLSQEGLAEMDAAVTAAPDNLEARFVRALTTWHLPFFFHRKAQAESDLAAIAPRAEQASRSGVLPPPLAAAALDYYGQVLAGREDQTGAQRAFEAALRVDPKSPGGQDARKRLKT
jgi:hypothetical protein